MDFYRCVTEKLLTYALGRGLEYHGRRDGRPDRRSPRPGRRRVLHPADGRDRIGAVPAAAEPRRPGHGREFKELMRSLTPRRTSASLRVKSDKPRRMRPMKPDHSHDEVIARRRAELSRRQFLRGMGVSMALPAFESMLAKGAGAAMAGAAGPRCRRPRRPVRPCGRPSSTCPTASICRTGGPKKEGKGLELNRTMEPLERFKDQIAGDRRAGPAERHRRQGRAGRPRPRLRDLPDRGPGQEDGRRRYPRGRLGRPGGRPGRSATSRGSPRSSWPATPSASRATATRAIPAPTSSTSRGPLPRCR